jgi:hypothetical protein
MNSINQVKEWIKYFNANIYNRDKKINTYEFAVEVSQRVLNELLEKKPNNHIFLGTTIRTDFYEKSNKAIHILVLITYTFYDNKYYIINNFYKIDDKITIDYLYYINCKKIVKMNLDDLIVGRYPYYDEGYFYEGAYVKKRYYIKLKEVETCVYYKGLYTNNNSNTNDITIFYPNFFSKYLSTSLSILDMLLQQTDF